MIVQTPEELKLSIIELDEIKKYDPDLMKFVKDLFDFKFIIEAAFPKKNNRKTAEELAVIMSQIQQSHLFEEGEGFKGRFVYEEKNGYVLL